MVPLGTTDVSRSWDNFSMMAAVCHGSFVMRVCLDVDLISVLTLKDPDSLVGAAPSRRSHTDLSTL